MQKQDREWTTSMSDTFEWLYVIFYLHAVLLFPFIRSKWGSTRPGFAGLFAFFFCIPVCAAMYHSHILATYFMPAWLLMVVYRKTESIINDGRLRNAGMLPNHSRYDGYPWLTGLLLFWDKRESSLKASEPGLMLILGGLLCAVEPEFGAFVATGFISLTGVEAVRRGVGYQRQRYYEDQQLEMEYEQEMMRRWRGR